MKLFLTSAGLPGETIEEFLKLLDKSPKKTNVCFITTASNPETDKRYVEKDRKRLEEFGFKITEVDLVQETKTSLKHKLKNFDVIFVEGGNTFYLLKYVRESGFDKVLSKLLDEEKIYLGVSAGSIIAGPNIEIAAWKRTWDKNITNLKDLVGLCLVPFSISPHYKEEDRIILEEKSKGVSYSVVALTDKQAVLVNGKNYKIVGSGKKHIFDTSKKFNL